MSKIGRPHIINGVNLYGTRGYNKTKIEDDLAADVRREKFDAYGSRMLHNRITQVHGDIYAQMAQEIRPQTA